MRTIVLKRKNIPDDEVPVVPVCFPCNSPSEELSFKVFERAHFAKRSRIVGGTSSAVHVLGRDAGGGYSTSKDISYLVAEVDVEKGEGFFLPAGTQVVCRSRPVSVGQFEHISVARKVNSTILGTDKDLVSKFGSKKRQKTLKEAAEAETVKVEKNLQKSILDALQKDDEVSSLSARQQSKENDNDETLVRSARLTLPSYDEKTEDVNSVYPSEGFFPSSIQPITMQAILKQAAQSATFTASLRSEEHPSFGALPNFVLTFLEQERKVSLSSEILSRLQFLTYAMMFHGVKDRDLNCARTVEEISDAMAIPLVVLSYLLNNFAEINDKGYFRTRLHRDTLLNHILLLALSVSSWKVPLKDLTQDLYLTQDILRNHLREIGCVVSGKEDKVAALKAPLRFPYKSSKSH